jgi:NADH-quinone oxidoreductase subunit N
MWFLNFGFAGQHQTGGYTGKFYVFAAADQHGWAWLVVVGVLATLVSLWYYLAIVRAMYMRAELRVAVVGGSPPREPLLHAAVGLSLVVATGSLFAVQPLIDLAKHATNALPF